MMACEQVLRSRQITHGTWGEPTVQPTRNSCCGDRCPCQHAAAALTPHATPCRLFGCPGMWQQHQQQPSVNKSIVGLPKLWGCQNQERCICCGCLEEPPEKKAPPNATLVQHRKQSRLMPWGDTGCTASSCSAAPTAAAGSINQPGMIHAADSGGSRCIQS